MKDPKERKKNGTRGIRLAALCLKTTVPMRMYFLNPPP